MAAMAKGEERTRDRGREERDLNVASAPSCLEEWSELEAAASGLEERTRGRGGEDERELEAADSSGLEELSNEPVKEPESERRRGGGGESSRGGGEEEEEWRGEDFSRARAEEENLRGRREEESVNELARVERAVNRSRPVSILYCIVSWSRTF